jgi:FAD/FMN-containing dehydrogenase
LTLGGGFGWLSNRYGLVVDNLISAELVLADGSIVRASETEHTDLFWAIRGCGSSFAIATEFVLQAYDQPDPVYAGIMAFTMDKLAQVVEYANKFDKSLQEIEDRGFAFGLGCPPPLFRPAVLVAIFYNGSEEAAKAEFAELFALGPVADITSEVPYEKVNGILSEMTHHGGRKSTVGSAAKFPVNPGFIQDVADKFFEFIAKNEGFEHSTLFCLQIPNKKINSVP